MQYGSQPTIAHLFFLLTLKNPTFKKTKELFPLNEKISLKYFVILIKSTFFVLENEYSQISHNDKLWQLNIQEIKY